MDKLRRTDRQLAMRVIARLAEALLDERRLKEEGFFEPQAIRRAWDAHLKGQNNQHKLWTILMFESWLDVRELA